MMALAPVLTADDLRHWRACARRFWLQRQAAPGAAALTATPDPMADTSLVDGPGPKAALRASFPGAVLIPEPSSPAQWAEAITRTQVCLSEARMQVEGAAIFGACLASDDGAQVRIDVLARGSHGLRVNKVRYATVGDEADVDTAALWAHVTARCGLRVQSVSLLLVDTDFLYPGLGCYAGLFREVDLAPVLGSRPVPAWLVAQRQCERGPLPAATAGDACKQHGGCAHAGACDAAVPVASPANAANPAALAETSLEILGRELAAELRAEGHADLHTVPPTRLSNPRHRRALRAVQAGLPVLDAAVAGFLQDQPYPRHFLRIDTIGFAVPLWPGTRPYQVLPFQWSCDVQQASGQLAHHSFLADDSGDPRRAFAATLLQVLGTRGPVLAYNAGFERNRILELAREFEDLASALEALLPRIVDLFQVARSHYYHPAMAGSWSFKSLSRAVAPQLQAHRFEWAGDTSTPAAFARSLQGGLEAARLQSLRSALREHGRRETHVLRQLVRLFEHAASALPTTTAMNTADTANAGEYLALFGHYQRDFGAAYLAPEDERYRLLFDQVCRLLLQASPFNLAMPQEFRRTARLYLEGDAATLAHMRVAEMRHFMLSDLYDYVHLSHFMGQARW